MIPQRDNLEATIEVRLSVLIAVCRRLHIDVNILELYRALEKESRRKPA